MQLRENVLTSERSVASEAGNAATAASTCSPTQWQ